MKIALIDIETTSKVPEEGNIVEIGICELDLQTGETRKLFDTLVKEHDFDPYEDAWIYHNSDLTPQEIERDGVHPSTFKDELQSIFNHYRCAAFQQMFDFTWLEHRGWKIPNIGEDMMLVADKILKIFITEITPEGKKTRRKWPSVQECLSYFGINEIEKHRAYPDCVQEAKIFYTLYKMAAIE